MTQPKSKQVWKDWIIDAFNEFIKLRKENISDISCFNQALEQNIPASVPVSKIFEINIWEIWELKKSDWIRFKLDDWWVHCISDWINIITIKSLLPNNQDETN